MTELFKPLHQITINADCTDNSGPQPTIILAQARRTVQMMALESSVLTEVLVFITVKDIIITTTLVCDPANGFKIAEKINTLNTVKISTKQQAEGG